MDVEGIGSKVPQRYSLDLERPYLQGFITILLLDSALYFIYTAIPNQFST